MRTGIGGKAWLSMFGFCACLLSGCSLEDAQTGEAPEPVKELKVAAELPAEREIASQVLDYLLRNCPSTESTGPDMQKHWPPRLRRFHKRQFRALEAICVNVKEIAVNGRRISIKGNYSGKVGPAAEIAFCNVILGTNATGNTSGHRLVDETGKTLYTCSSFNFSS